MSRIKTRSVGQDLSLNLFFTHLCSFSSQYNLKKYLKVNLNGRLPPYETYETYRSRLDATRFQVPSENEALCIACIQ